MTGLTLRPRTLDLGLVGRPYAYRRDMLLQEDMSGYVTLEDETGRVLLETDGEATPWACAGAILS